MSISKIITGGQTGVDRAALDAALEHDIPHGGWCPKGRVAEDGIIDKKYNLMDMPDKNYSSRTKQNVKDSDATFIIYRDSLSGGTLLTYNYAKRINKPVYKLDLTKQFLLDDTLEWLLIHSVQILNIAGPRESLNKGIYVEAKEIINELFDLIMKNKLAIMQYNDSIT